MIDEQLDLKIIDALRDKASALMEAVESGNLKESVDLINILNKTRQEVFYEEVGVLTRTLHNSIKAYGIDLGEKLNSNSETVVENASQSLSYVIDITEKNSHETMDRVDSLISQSQELSKQNAQIIESLRTIAQLEEVKDKAPEAISTALELTEINTAKINEMEMELMNIIVSQGIQDISGQLIRKVIDLLSDVELKLVSLVRMASNIEELSPLAVENRANEHVEQKVITGPQIDKNNENAAHSQEDVDDLLSNLGF